jgi:hypothetical protein
MDLARMLDKCHAGQWHADDLDWSAPPPILPRAKEEAVVQAFTDMAGIERLAAALFTAARAKATDPTLAAIFASFVEDEDRHAVVAQRLARYYDVHHYRDYQLAPALRAFREPFLAVIDQAGRAPRGDGAAPGGELAAPRRHRGGGGAHAVVRAAVLAPGVPRSDRSHRSIGRRLREALKRIQLIARKPTIAGPVLAKGLLRLLGAEARIAARLYTEAELARSQAMTFDELAEDALAAKLA